MSEAVIIKMIDYGESVGSRELGREIRQKAAVLLKEEKGIFFDFFGVHIISSAFADELFGKLFGQIGREQFKEHIKINRFSNEEDRQVILLLIKKAIDFRETHTQSS